MLKLLAGSCWGIMLKVFVLVIATHAIKLMMYRIIVIIAAVPVHSAYFGEGDSNLTIILDDITCYGNETSLENCQSINSTGSNIDCGHFEDAGVICNCKHQIMFYTHCGSNT